MLIVQESGVGFGEGGGLVVHRDMGEPEVAAAADGGRRCPSHLVELR